MTSLTGYALSRGAKAAWIEVGGAGADEERWARVVADGIARALAITGVIKPDAAPPATDEPRLLDGSVTSMRTSAPGIYQPILREKDVGSVVVGETEIGRLIDPLTLRIIETYRTPHDKTASCYSERRLL